VDKQFTRPEIYDIIPHHPAFRAANPEKIGLLAPGTALKLVWVMAGHLPRRRISLLEKRVEGVYDV